MDYIELRFRLDIEDSSSSSCSAAFVAAPQLLQRNAPSLLFLLGNSSNCNTIRRRIALRTTRTRHKHRLLLLLYTSQLQGESVLTQVFLILFLTNSSSWFFRNLIKVIVFPGKLEIIIEFLSKTFSIRNSKQAQFSTHTQSRKQKECNSSPPPWNSHQLPDRCLNKCNVASK